MEIGERIAKFWRWSVRGQDMDRQPSGRATRLRLTIARYWKRPDGTLLRLLLAGLFVYAIVHSAQQAREAVLGVRCVDATTGKPVPVRVRLENSHGVRPHVKGALTVSDSAILIPKQALAVMWGRSDMAEGYALQPDGSFYTDGGFDVTLEPGTYSLTLSKGNEYLAQTHTITLKPGQRVAQKYVLKRWINMPAQGWFSSDDHVHLRRSPRDDANILRWMQAEDVHVGNLLQMGDFWTTTFSQYAFGGKGRYQEGEYVLSSGQEEPRTPEIGHTIGLGAEEFVRFQRDYYSYGRAFDRIHQLGGVTGFAHQGISFHGYRGMVLNVLRQKVDFLELVQFCVPEGPLAVQHYYPFLDLGFKLTALAGSDFPWCGHGPTFGFAEQCAQIGNARFYAYVGGKFSFEKWLDALKNGHTFATTGPVVLLHVDGHMPGDTIDVKHGSRLRITAEAFGEREQTPLSTLEIVAHGKVLRQATGDKASKLRIELELPVERGTWIAARCKAGKGQVAHTTPVYVTVDGGGFYNPDTAPQYIAESGKFLDDLEKELAHPGNGLDDQAYRYKNQLEEQIGDARSILRRLSTTLK